MTLTAPSVYRELQWLLVSLIDDKRAILRVLPSKQLLNAHVSNGVRMAPLRKDFD
jgi:hypothetical protein